jgi:hypothetical protein
LLRNTIGDILMPSAQPSPLTCPSDKAARGQLGYRILSYVHATSAIRFSESACSWSFGFADEAAINHPFI